MQVVGPKSRNRLGGVTRGGASVRQVGNRQRVGGNGVRGSIRSATVNRQMPNKWKPMNVL